MSNYPEDVFVANRWILKCASLWRPDNPPILLGIVFNVYSLVVLVFVTLFFTATEGISLLSTYHNFSHFIKNIGLFLTHFMGAIKVLFWYSKGELLHKLMNTLDKGNYRYETIGNYNPGEITKKYKRIGIIVSIFSLCVPNIMVIYGYSPLLLKTITLMHDGNFSDYNMNLPYFSWLPFSYDTPEGFIIAIFYQFIPMFIYAYIIAGMDSLFINIMNFIAAHLKILQGAFKTIKSRSMKKLSNTNNNANKELIKIMHFEMKKCCQHLQTIYDVCEALENTYKFLTFTQATASLFIFCTCLYLVSTIAVASAEFLSEIIYIMGMGAQLFLYCWFGNEVTLQAHAIPDFIWECDWLDTDMKFKQNVIFTMNRLKKPIYLTVGKFAPLTLETFVKIVKASYSVFTLIQNTDDED